MIDTIIFDVGRVLVNWDYESYLKRFAFGPEKTKAIAAATFEGPYWRQFDRGILAPEEIVKGFELGADEYITKPFRPRELLSRIRNVIRHTGILEENRQEIQIEHVKMNLEQGAVYKNNERIELTALEYKILALFFENKGRILTRGQILSGIWDESGNFVNNNTLTVYIKRLREKIEEDPNAPKIIKTVRGMGYKAGV